MNKAQIDLLRMLTARLERLSVDSIWARRASGLRGSLIKALESIDEGDPISSENIELLIELSFEILRNAAREIPDAEPNGAHQKPNKEEIMPRNYEGATPTQYQRIPNHTRDDAWIKEFLRRSEIGHLAHSQGEQPFVTPTNFWLDEKERRIIFHSNIAGRMRDNLEHQPRVCLEVSEYGRFLPANTALEFGVQYRSVMVFGTVQVLDDATEKSEALYSLLNKYFPHMTPGKEYRPITSQELARTTVYTLQIESWSGKENWDEQAEQLPDWPALSQDLLTPN